MEKEIFFEHSDNYDSSKYYLMGLENEDKLISQIIDEVKEQIIQRVLRMTPEIPYNDKENWEDQTRTRKIDNLERKIALKEKLLCILERIDCEVLHKLGRDEIKTSDCILKKI